jgi:ATP-dependent 26S proteasome regulatory subunit
MSMHETTTKNCISNVPVSWEAANENYLEAGLRCLRLRIKRRILWLRLKWAKDPLQNYQAIVVSDAQADQLLPGEDWDGEARYYEENQIAAAITRSLREAEQALSDQLRELFSAGQIPAIELLGHLFGLTQFDKQVLLLCLAPEIDPTFERLYAYLQDDAKRTYATPRLALALFASASSHSNEGTKRPDARKRLLSDAPLRHYRLVTLDSSTQPAALASARPLHLDERIADYLLGINRLDERVADTLRPVAAGLLAPSQRERVGHLATILKTERRQGCWPILNLIGESGSGKGAFARALSEQLHMQLHLLDVRHLPVSGRDFSDTLRLLEREAALLHMAFYLDATDIDTADPVLQTSVKNVIEQLNAILIVGSRERLRCERELLALPIERPDVYEQRALWRKALAGRSDNLNGSIDALVEQFDFGPKAIAQTVTAAEGRLKLRVSQENGDLTIEDLWHAAREQAGWRIESLAQRITPCYTWEDLVLPDDVFRQLQEIADQVAHRAHVYETWGFGAKLSRGRGINALFAGPSGTGKTMAAEVLANHLKLDLYRIDLAGVVSKYIGETEKNLKKVFDAAEQSGAILFFDEADALFGKRTEVKDSHDRYANIEVNYLLQRMEDYRGLAILATNRKSSLDHAFLRRLRFLVDFPFPRADSRQLIWQKVFPVQAGVDGIDYKALARLEITGGNIRNIALNAAFLAAGESCAIRMNHIMRAARREYAKIDKMVTSAEFGVHYEAMRA